MYFPIWLRRIASDELLLRAAQACHVPFAIFVTDDVRDY